MTLTQSDLESTLTRTAERYKLPVTDWRLEIGRLYAIDLWLTAAELVCTLADGREVREDMSKQESAAAGTKS